MSDKQLIILLIIILVAYLAIKPQVYEGLPPPPLPPKEKRIIVPKKDDNFEKHFSPRSDIPRDKKVGPWHRYPRKDEE